MLRKILLRLVGHVRANSHIRIHIMLTTHTHTHTTHIHTTRAHTQRINFRTFFSVSKIYWEESCHDKGVNDFRISQLFERVSCESESRA